MAKRHNHYEAAFEDYLRSRQIAYIAVNEQRRAIEAGGSLKNIDFIASPGDMASPRWLIDVKGRQFPSGRQYWRNWTTDEELTSLERWGARFGGDFLGVLVFAYELTGDRSPVPPHEVHYFRERPYAFVAIPADRYRALARPLSARWGTVSVPVAAFREAACPVATTLGISPFAAEALA